VVAAAEKRDRLPVIRGHGAHATHRTSVVCLMRVDACAAYVGGPCAPR
jgi:hypothetical protein